jgi:hypothetical protein
MSFKPGDVVIYTSNMDDFYTICDEELLEYDIETAFSDVGAHEDLLGKVGTVIDAGGYDGLIAVDFGFEFGNAHNLGGRISTDTGYWVHPSLIRHAITEPLKELEEML